MSKTPSTEFTWTQQVNYSMALDPRKTRELADHLDLTVRDMARLIEAGELFDEHETGVLEFIERNSDLVNEESRDGIEFDQVMAG